MNVKESLLFSFSDINYVYNDSSKYDTLKKGLLELEEVVLCKDCKYYDPPLELDGMRFEGDCKFHEWYRAEPKEDDYCSRGERMN